MGMIEHHKIGTVADIDTPNFAATGARAACELRHRTGCVRCWLHGWGYQYVAAPCLQPHAVLEPAQFFDRIDRDMAVGTNSPGTLARKIISSIEKAVTEIGLGSRTQPGDAAAVGHR